MRSGLFEARGLTEFTYSEIPAHPNCRCLTRNGLIYLRPSRERPSLTLVVIRMAEAWYQARRLSGGVNLQLITEADKRIFEKVSFVASSSSDFNLEGDLFQAAIERGVRFEGKFMDQFDNELRPHICGQVDLRTAKRVGVLKLLAVVDQQKPLLISRLAGPWGRVFPSFDQRHWAANALPKVTGHSAGSSIVRGPDITDRENLLLTVNQVKRCNVATA
jgi:hypothetical protein